MYINKIINLSVLADKNVPRLAVYSEGDQVLCGSDYQLKKMPSFKKLYGTLLEDTKRSELEVAFAFLKW